MGRGFFFFKEKEGKGVVRGLVGSEMCIRGSLRPVPYTGREQHGLMASVMAGAGPIRYHVGAVVQLLLVQ